MIININIKYKSIAPTITNDFPQLITSCLLLIKYNSAFPVLIYTFIWR